MYLVHGVMVSTVAEELKVKIDYAKSTPIPRYALYEVHGEIKMAHGLNAITTEEYLKLEHECVYDGINNPKYF